MKGGNEKGADMSQQQAPKDATTNDKPTPKADVLRELPDVPAQPDAPPAPPPGVDPDSGHWVADDVLETMLLECSGMAPEQVIAEVHAGNFALEVNAS